MQKGVKVGGCETFGTSGRKNRSTATYDTPAGSLIIQAPSARFFNFVVHVGLETLFGITAAAKLSIVKWGSGRD